MMQILLNPWAVIASMVGGLLVGIYQSSWVPYLIPVGKIYISLLTMCVVPIMISAVVVSISALVRSDSGEKTIMRVVLTFAIYSVVIAGLATAIGVFALPYIGHDHEMKRTIGRLMLTGDNAAEVPASHEATLLIKEIDTRFSGDESQTRSLEKFLLNIVPKNIFDSLSQGKNLHIIFFFIIMSLMMRYVGNEYFYSINSLFRGIYEAFQKLINILMYLLPFGLFSLLAEQFSVLGFSVFISLLNLVVLVYISCFVVLFISSLIIWRKSRLPYFYQFIALQEAIIVTIGTRSSFATLPLAISGMVEKLKFEEEMSQLSISLGLTLAKHGKTMLFCLAAVFASSLYSVEITATSVIIILLSSILAGMASSGTPSIISRGMVAMVLLPLEIPSGAIIALLIAIDPVIDPIITLVSTYPNYAASAMLAKKLPDEG